MRKFLKNNALAILVCLAAVGTLASATTITRPYGASDYAGGTKAVGTKVNAEFASIVAWLNGGNISSDNIATAGVATANIASFAVTSAKIATLAVSKDKLSAANLSVTSGSSLYLLENTVTPATVSNLSTVFTSQYGRPTRISLEPNPGTYQASGFSAHRSFIQAAGNGASSLGSAIFFVRDSSTTAHWQLLSGIATASTDYLPCSGFSYTEIGLVAGVSYTYAVKASTGNASDTSIFVANCRLVVEEL